MFRVPAKQCTVLIGNGTLSRLRTVSNKCCIRVRSVYSSSIITFMDIILNIYRVTNYFITVFYHQAFTEFPISANQSIPFGTHPLVTIRIHIQIPAQFVNGFIIFFYKGTDSACHNINNRMRNLMLLYVLDT